MRHHVDYVAHWLEWNSPNLAPERSAQERCHFTPVTHWARAASTLMRDDCLIR